MYDFHTTLLCTFHLPLALICLWCSSWVMSYRWQVYREQFEFHVREFCTSALPGSACTATPTSLYSVSWTIVRKCARDAKHSRTSAWKPVDHSPVHAGQLHEVVGVVPARSAGSARNSATSVLTSCWPQHRVSGAGGRLRRRAGTVLTITQTALTCVPQDRVDVSNGRAPADARIPRNLTQSFAAGTILWSRPGRSRRPCLRPHTPQKTMLTIRPASRSALSGFNRANSPKCSTEIWGNSITGK